MNAHVTLLYLTTAVALSACGGGSPPDEPAAPPTSSANPSPPPPPASAPSGHSGGYAGVVTGGGSAAPVVVSSAAEMQAAINAYSGGGLALRYTGRFDFSAITDACDQWQKPAGAIVEIKNKRDVTIEGAQDSAANLGIAIKADASNVIVRNMTIGLLPGSIDAIGIEGQGGKSPSNIWIDHNTLFSSMKECPGAGDLEFDGLVDNKAGAHPITYSYNHLHDHHKAGLIGSSESDISDRFITYHHNVYQNVGSRLPLQRGGYTHLYNNLYSGVSASGANIRLGGHSLIEANWVENAKNPVTSRDSATVGYWDLRNNNVMSAADFATYGITWTTGSSVQRNADDWTTTARFPVTLPYADTPQPATCVKQRLLAVAGAGKGMLPLRCD